MALLAIPSCYVCLSISQNDDDGARFLKQKNEHGWWIEVESNNLMVAMREDDNDHNSHESEVGK
jgi:hypothetical protein